MVLADQAEALDHLPVAPEHLEFVCYDSNNNEVKFMPFEEPRPPVRRRMR